MKFKKIKEEELIESKTSDIAFEDAWDSLDIDMGSSVMSLKQFDDFMSNIKELTWQEHQ